MMRLHSFRFIAAASFILLFALSTSACEEPTQAAVAGFNEYVAGVESRLARQHQSAGDFLAPPNWDRVNHGELVIEHLTPVTAKDLPGALMQDWRGTAFVPGASGKDFERVMRNFAAFSNIYSPQVLRATSLTLGPNHYQVSMRVRQKHVLTVVMDMTYDTVFGRLDPQHGFSNSRSIEIREIDQAGTGQERALSGSEQHGFLWRLNNYWGYEERDGGLYIQVESVSLSRSAPNGLAWMIGPFIESVPKESLEFTLAATRNALKK